MIVLPIVDRELRVAGRRAATFRTRLWAALGAMLLVAWLCLGLSTGGASPSSQGQSLFYTLSGLAFLFCLAMGPRITADCLSEEKREGTLGLLFLTDLKGMDVVLGKLVASSVNSFYALLAVLPFLALPTLLGGVTLAEFGRMVVVLLNALFFSLSVGMLVSALSRNDRKAIFATLVLVFGIALLPFVFAMFIALVLEAVHGPEDVFVMLPMLMVSPVLPFLLSLPWPGPALPFPIPASVFWSSVALIHLTSWAALLLTARILPAVWKDRHRVSSPRQKLDLVARWRVWTYGNPWQRKALRLLLLDRNPFLWLVSRDRLKPGYAWFFIASMVLIWCGGYIQHQDVMFDFYPLVPTVVLVHSFLKVWVVAEVCHRVIEDRKNGAFELLLSTPLTTSHIVEGQQMAVIRQFAKPVLALCAIELVTFRNAFPPHVLLLVMVVLVADLLTLMFISVRLSLRARSINEVLLKSLGCILILPWVVYLAASPTWQSLWREWRPLGYRRYGFNERVYFWFAISMLNNAFWVFVWARSEWMARARRLRGLWIAASPQLQDKWKASPLKVEPTE
jgi:ABC-type transport system involved in multi-copper enzyme maturation permease subunit